MYGCDVGIGVVIIIVENDAKAAWQPRGESELPVLPHHFVYEAIL